MGLKVFQRVAVHDYWNGGVFEADPNRPFFVQSISDVNGRSSVYMDGLDSVIAYGNRSAGSIGAMRFDPLCIVNTAGAAFFSDGLPENLAPTGGYMVGEFDKVAGTQKVYGSVAGSDWYEFNPITMVQGSLVPFLNVFDNSGQQNGRTGAENGFWANGSFPGAAMLFDTPGYALRLGGQIRAGTVGGGGGTVFDGVMFAFSLIDTGATTKGDAMTIGDFSEANPIDIPIWYNSVIENDFTRPQIFGQNIHFAHGQFVPDDDSTVLRPKGFLFLQGGPGGNWWTHDAGPPIVKARAVKLVDWNPTSVVGIPNRIHTRERILSRVLVTTGDRLDYLDTDNGINSILGSSSDQKLIWHRPSNRILLHTIDTVTGSPFTEDPYLDARFLKTVILPVPEVFLVTQPAQDEAVETDKTTQFSATVYGDLGERIEGASVTFDLSAISVAGEAVTSTNTGGETVSVALPPIDINSIAVYSGGTPLAAPGQYTALDLAAGTFELVGAHADGEITVDYSYQQRADLQVVAEDITTNNVFLDPTGTQYSPFERDTLVLYRSAAPGVPLIEFTDYDLVDGPNGTFRMLLEEVNGTITADYTVTRPDNSYGTLLTPSTLSDETGRATTRVKQGTDTDNEGLLEDLRAVTVD